MAPLQELTGVPPQAPRQVQHGTLGDEGAVGPHHEGRIIEPSSEHSTPDGFPTAMQVDYVRAWSLP